MNGVALGLSASLLGAVLSGVGLSTLVVVGGPDEWVLQIRNGACVRAGIGASVWRRPGDVVVRLSLIHI